LEAATLLRAARAAVEASETEDGALRALLDRIDAACGAALRKDLRDRIRGLYVIIDPGVLRDRDALHVTKASLAGGARIIQLRDKTQDKGDALPLARDIRKACEAADALFIMNDHADLAVACGADGLHVGQHDLPVAEARKVLSPRQIVGTSNATAQEGSASERMGVDYVAVGAIYETATKSNTRPAGLDTLRRVKASVNVPVVAIGGINAGNVASVVQAGADSVCVVSAVTLAWDPEAAARELAAAIRGAGGRA
jgi:thiamine-phosphate pyrophosphorylase